MDVSCLEVCAKILGGLMVESCKPVTESLLVKTVQRKLCMKKTTFEIKWLFKFFDQIVTELTEYILSDKC